MGAAAFSYIRGDDFQQPFTVTLDQSRSLDGSESWTFSVRETKSSALLLTMVSPTEITIGADPFNPTIVFTPTSLPAAQFPLATGDKTYKYDLEMAKGGKFETVAIDDFTVTGDITQ